MSNATVVERVTALEPTTRDDFADEPTAAPTETDREPTSKSDHRHAAQQREPARTRPDRRALHR